MEKNFAGSHTGPENATQSALFRSGKWWRYRRLPTWRVWSIILLALAVLIIWVVPKLHGVLAITDPVMDAPYIVVEGWAPDYVVLEARDAADDSKNKLVIATGIPLELGTYLTSFDNYAEVAAGTLAKAGLDPQRILPVPAQAVERDRTAAMAAALKAVLDKMNIPPADRRLNLFTLGTHARRSRLLFQRILGPDWQVGIVSVPDQSYRAADWWRQSSGAKRVIDELAALAVAATGRE